MPSKTLLVFSDGTQQDGNLTVGAANGSTTTRNATNVLRLSRSVKPYTSDNQHEQIVLYQSGVGSESNFQGEEVAGAQPMYILGTSVASKIRDAYAFLAQNFADGDEVCLFGFSRGAYTARKLAILIDKIGLLKTEDLKLFFSIWRALVDGNEPYIPPTTRRPKIKCLGVWDTVGSVYNVIDVLEIDTKLPACVTTAFHALAMQENREKFLPTRFSQDLNSDQELVQIWFPGAHSDVGGSYDPHELADIALFWMAGEIDSRSLINLDLDFLARNRQPDPDPWGTSQPHNAYDEAAFLLKPVLGHKTRLQSGDIQEDDKFHESVQYAPTTLTNPKYMITLDDLQKSFGSGWSPVCPALNTFEKKCKDDWNSEIDGDPVTYENVQADLFPEQPGVLWVGGGQNFLENGDLVQGGLESDDTVLNVARAYYNNGLYLGSSAAGSSDASIGADGSEIDVSTYEVLSAPIGTLRWLEMQGTFDGAKLGGETPLNGGYDRYGNTLFVAKAAIDGGGVRCGRVSYNSTALIPYDGTELSVDNYFVLVYNAASLVTVDMGNYATQNDASQVGQGGTNSATINISPKAYLPSVVVGLKMLDIGNQGTSIRVRAYADGITTTQFAAHIDTWYDTTLYNATIDWLATDIPELQSGLFSTTDVRGIENPGNVIHRVDFPIAFPAPPKVFIALSALDIDNGGTWDLRTYATDVDAHGFTINFINGNPSSKLYSSDVNWVAFPESLLSVWSGRFGSEEAGTLTGHINFGITFASTPTLLVALNQFSIDKDHNLRVNLVTSNVTTSGMDWEIQTWSDSVLYSVGASFLAIVMSG